MSIREQIINSLEPLVVDPEHVFIDQETLKKKTKEFLGLTVPPWNNDLQFIGTPEETAQYYFFLDSINFCFWAPKGEERWAYEVDGQWISGYYAYSRAIKDAFLKNPQLFDADYVSKISKEDFKNMFKGKNSLLLLEERLVIIQENFTILKEKFGGQAINLIKQAENDADRFVWLLLEHFTSFRDIPSDLSFTGIPELRFSNLEHLTAFADYKLPQLFESLGILKYSEELDSDILNERLIPAGSVKERELRASSILAVEQMREELNRRERNITAQELDWILWVKAKETKFKKPHHKTVTVFY